MKEKTFTAPLELLTLKMKPQETAWKSASPKNTTRGDTSTLLCRSLLKEKKEKENQTKSNYVTIVMEGFPLSYRRLI